jgi:hypothetical protein
MTAENINNKKGKSSIDISNKDLTLKELQAYIRDNAVRLVNTGVISEDDCVKALVSSFWLTIMLLSGPKSAEENINYSYGAMTEGMEFTKSVLKEIEFNNKHVDKVWGRA